MTAFRFEAAWRCNRWHVDVYRGVVCVGTITLRPGQASNHDDAEAIARKEWEQHEILEAQKRARRGKNMNENEKLLFTHALDRLAGIAHQIATNKGWWESDRNDGELIALMHSELSEAFEAWRKEVKHSEHIPDFTGIEEEMADAIIRILDYSAARKLRIGEAVIIKMEFNETRPYKHGGKRA